MAIVMREMYEYGGFAWLSVLRYAFSDLALWSAAVVASPAVEPTATSVPVHEPSLPMPMEPGKKVMPWKEWQKHNYLLSMAYRTVGTRRRSDRQIRKYAIPSEISKIENQEKWKVNAHFVLTEKTNKCSSRQAFYRTTCIKVSFSEESQPLFIWCMGPVTQWGARSTAWRRESFGLRTSTSPISARYTRMVDADILVRVSYVKNNALFLKNDSIWALIGRRAHGEMSLGSTLLIYFMFLPTCQAFHCLYAGNAE